MIGSAWKIFGGMSPSERRNLRRLNFWLNQDRKRKPGEHLEGPEYIALRHLGVIGDQEPSPAFGQRLRITELGQDVLRYIGPYYVP